MTIKQKIAFSTTILLIVVLIIADILIYHTFLNLSSDHENDMLSEHAQTVGQKLSEQLPDTYGHILETELPESGFARIVDPTGHILNYAQNEEMPFDQIKPKYVKNHESELITLSHQKVLIVRVPIIIYSDKPYMLEIGESLESLQENSTTLITILILTTLLAVTMGIIGSFLLSKLIVRPISRMITSMQIIEQSLDFQQILVTGQEKDELHMMAVTFNRMIKRIHDSFIQQQQFISDASHELRTPLTALEGYASMLRRWGLDNPEKGRKAADAIYHEAVRMRKMTEQLLELASTEKDSVMYKESVEMVSFCQQTADLLKDVYQRDIRVQANEQAIPIQIDSVKIKQVLLILLDNALKYSQNSITIKLNMEKDKEGNPSFLQMIVKDEGIGIAKDDLERVFERFYRVDPSRQRRTGGTGLGLAIARNIVLLHGGTIALKSQEGNGTEVMIRLPF
jgi:two-component system sensor histidine kinase ArlS